MEDDTTTESDLAKLQEQVANLNKALTESREANTSLKDWKTQQEADAAEAARQKAEKDGEFQSLYEKAQAERDELAAKYEALSTRDKARIEAVDASNAERLSKLPEHLQGLTAGLTGDALAKQLTGLEKLTTDTRAKGGRGGGGDKPGEFTAEEKAEAERLRIPLEAARSLIQKRAVRKARTNR